MKKILLFFAIGLISLTIKAQNEFISIWQSTNEYPTIEIPTYNEEVYNYTVDWGDGSTDNNVVGDINHNYAATGNYTVTITGVFPGINFSKIFPQVIIPYNRHQILSVEQWGNNQWKNMQGAFKGQESLVINANDTPELSQCTTMSEMFYRCENLNNSTSISWNFWNTSTITNMSSLFFSSPFNKLISNWNVSNVLDMSDMFMFSGFNQPIGNWIVEKVTNMSYMFNNSVFNQNISNWNVSNVNNMSNMFFNNLVFNQPINSWNVSNVLDMSLMFQSTRDFNQNLNSWNVSKVTNMEQMFFESNFNGNITSWDVSEVINMGGMFYNNDNFNQPIGNWNVNKVEDMSGMFSGLSIFNQDISNWDISSVTTLSFTFANDFFNQDISNWNTANVTNMHSTFFGNEAFDQDISSWNVENVTSCFRMFENTKMSTTNYDALLIGWNAQNLRQDVTLSAGSSKYFSNAAQAARQNMMDNDNWIIVDDGQIEVFTWTGANGTNWNDPGNWDTNSVPTQNDNVILADVANAPFINFGQNQVVNDFTNHEVLTIRSNASLTVLGDIDQRNTISISSFVNTNGSLVVRGQQLNLNPPDIIYLRYVSGSNWHMIGSPATNTDIDNFAAATGLAEGQGNNRGIGFYDNNANPKWSYYQNGAINTGDFVTGKGYSIMTSANAFLNFTGKLFANNLVNYPITENLDGWNLIGNPYPSFINVNTNADENENLLTENADDLDPAFASIYVWNPNTTSYEPIGNGLGARYIAPGQGFFVKSKNGGGTININKTMLSHQAGDLFLKENQSEKIVLQINDNTNVSETTIAFKNGMTKGLDVTYDAAVFSGENKKLSIYTHLIENKENLPFAIQFLPELENNDFVIPLGISQKGNSEISFSLKETSLSNNQKIYLEDNVENTFIEISNQTNYKFSLQENTSETGRFYLHFQQKSLSLDAVDTSSISVYKSKNTTLNINGIFEGLLNIYSITGQNILKNKEINSNSETIQIPKIAKGVYIIKINYENKEFVKKILF